MKKNILYGAVVASALLVTSLVTVAFGQGGAGRAAAAAGQPGRGGMQQMAPPVQTIVKYGTGSVYTLTGMTLTQFDAATLKQTGMVTLEETPAPTPAAVQPNAAAGAAQHPMMRRGGGGQPIFVLVNDAAIVIRGGSFYRVSLADMKVAVKSELPKPAIDAAAPPAAGNVPPATAPAPAPGAQQGGKRGQRGPGGPGMGGPGGMRGAGMLPTVEPVINGDTMYLARGPELLAINIVDGKVTAQTTVPGIPTAVK